MVILRGVFVDGEQVEGVAGLEEGVEVLLGHEAAVRAMVGHGAVGLMPRAVDVPQLVGVEVAEHDAMGRISGGFFEGAEAGAQGWQQAGVFGQFAAGLGAVFHQAGRMSQREAGAPQDGLS